MRLALRGFFPILHPIVAPQQIVNPKESTMLTPEQITASSKESLEAFLEVSSKAFAGVEKLVELNLLTARTAFEEGSETAKAALSVKDAQELLALQAGLLQPAADKASAYGRQVYEIAQATSGEVAKLIEAQVAGAQQKFVAVVETASKNAPAGSENAVALVKSAVAAATNAVETAQKAAKQAVSVAEANFQTLTAQATSAAKAAAQAAPKARRTAA
jgi:phasin family protein